MSEILIRYLHFIGIMAIGASFIAEYLLLDKEISLVKLKIILKFDIVIGASAILILLTGLLQWFIVGKPSEYYNSNALFHIKFMLFLVIAIFSLFPTRYFIKKRKQAKGVVRIPPSIFTILLIELFLLILIPLLAVMIANGIGVS